MSGSDRARLLALAQCLPYPPEAGVTKRTYHVLTELQVEFDVVLLAYTRRAHQPNDSARARARLALSEQLTWVGPPVAIGRETSRARLAADQLRSLLTGRPYVFYEYASAGFREALAGITCGGDFDLVHLDSLDLYRWIPLLPSGVPVACTHHNVESELLRRSSRHVKPLPLAWYYRHQARLLERVERRLCPTLDLNVMVSETDERTLRSLAPGSKTIVTPNGVDTDFFHPPDESTRQKNRIVFIGGTYSLPNRDAVDFFLEEIWPSVKMRNDVSFEVVGRPGEEKRPWPSDDDSVEFPGHVPDVRDHLGTAACSVVPLRIGGGTRLKILDAWAMGTPVVSTSIGCEGLDARDGENILIRDEPRAFAAAVLELLENERLRRHLGEEGRRTAVDSYSWGRIGDRLRDAYRELLA